MKLFTFLFSLLRLRAVAINEAAREAGFLVAANIAPLAAYDGDKPPAEEWLPICPYGEYPNVMGRQIVNRANTEKMVAAFNSLAGKASRLFRGLPIFIGHPDVMPQRWSDDRRIGKVVDFRAGEVGPECKVAWNDLGLRNREQGYHVYPSPAWLFPKNNRGIVEPDELLSIGMVNSPQIADALPWTANSKPGPGNSNTTEMKRELVIKLLGLAADATDEQINIALNASSISLPELNGQLSTANAKMTTAEGQLATANGKVTTLEGQLTAANGKVATAQTALLDAAIASGRITAAERPTHEAAFNSDFGVAATALAAKKETALNTKELDLGGRKVAIATATERQAVITAAVNSVMATNGGDYDAAFNAVQSDPKYAAVFEAMKKPEASTK